MDEDDDVTTEDIPFPLYSRRKFRFWQRGAFILIGGTGTGKSSIIEESLLDPRRFFKFDDRDEDDPSAFSWPQNYGPPIRETALYFFCGASLATKRRLENELDSSVFHKVHWLQNDQWDVLEKAFAESIEWEKSKNPSQRRHVIVIDDFVVQNELERKRVITLLTHNKRHQCCCIVLLTHQFVGHKSAHPVADNCERVYFTRTEQNYTNLRAFTKRKEVPYKAFQDAAESLSIGKDEENRIARDKKKRLFDFVCYDLQHSCFIGSFRTFESGGVSSAIGKPILKNGCANSLFTSPSRTQSSRTGPRRWGSSTTFPRSALFTAAIQRSNERIRWKREAGTTLSKRSREPECSPRPSFSHHYSRTRV